MKNPIKQLLDGWFEMAKATDELNAIYHREECGIKLLKAINKINKTDVAKSKKLLSVWLDSKYYDVVDNPNQYLDGWRYR